MPQRCHSPVRLTLRGQVEADVAIEVHGAMEAAVAELTQAEGAAAAQLPALGVVAFLRGHVSIRQGLPAVACWQEGWSAPRAAGSPLPPPNAAGTLFIGNAGDRMGTGKAA